MYLITVSEMLGTNGKRIADQVAQTLGYTFYGEEELFKKASEMGFLPDIQKMDEKNPPFFEKFFTEKPKIYLDRLQSVIYEVARKGNAVFFGRGSQLLLKSFSCALHILVMGSKEKRILRIMEENRVKREIAEKLIERSDRDKRGFLRFAFDEDWLNPQMYDLVLNTDKLSVDSAVQVIVSSARSDEIKACGVDSVRQLGILSLARRAESALLEAGIVSPHLFIEAEDLDRLRVYGMANSLDEKRAIGDILGSIQGIKKVVNDLQVYPGAMGGI